MCRLPYSVSTAPDLFFGDFGEMRAFKGECILGGGEMLKCGRLFAHNSFGRGFEKSFGGRCAAAYSQKSSFCI